MGTWDGVMQTVLDFKTATIASKGSCEICFVVLCITYMLVGGDVMERVRGVSDK